MGGGGGAGQIQKVRPIIYAPREFWGFTFSEVCFGTSEATFSCMHTVHT